MRYSFHRMCFPCPERLPAPCSTASDELINIIKANLPHHSLPAKAGTTCSPLRALRSARWWLTLQRESDMAEPCVETVRREGEEMKGRAMAAQKCQLCQLLQRGGDQRAFLLSCCRVRLWSLAAGVDEICYDCRESRPSGDSFLKSNTPLFTGWHALWQATSRSGFGFLCTVKMRE